jgi:hypothetical protein
MSSPSGDFPADELGQELLSEAGQRDAVNLDSIRELLRKGADVNYRGNIGETPLIVAAVNLELDLIRLLLEKGADKTIRSDPGGDFANKNALELARDALVSDPDYADGPEIIRLLSDPVAPPGGEPAGGAKKKKKKGGRRFTRKQCKKFKCAKMGFTQKASCRPYKNCYRSKKSRK